MLETFTDRPFFTNLNKKLQTFFLDENLKTNLDFKKSYIFSGSFGTGKTTESILIMREYCKFVYPKGFELANYHLSPVYINFETLLEAVDDNNGYDSEKRYNASLLLFNAIEANFLILDDFDIVETTDFRTQNLKNFIYKLFDKRYNENLTTIVITNADFKTLKTFYSGKILDRILGLCSVKKIDGVSKRTGLDYDKF